MVGVGSAAAFHLARRGRRVLGLERFDVPNRMGSSHGLTRVIRLAYSESPGYVPLLRRAFHNWREAGRLYGEPLLSTAGLIGAALFRPDRFAVFYLAVGEGRYDGLPVWGMPGFKIGRCHHLGVSCLCGVRVEP